MFEARLVQGNLFKKIVEAIKDLVAEANVDCNEQGLTMQVRRGVMGWLVGWRWARLTLTDPSPPLPPAVIAMTAGATARGSHHTPHRQHTHTHEQAMDASHVSLCSLTLRESGFDHFRCDRNLSLGLNLGNLAKILKCAGNDDSVTLKAEDEPDTLTLMFENEKADRISDFELKLMEIETEHLGIPNEEYKCTVSMPSAEFQRIVRDLAVIGETCTIACTKEGVQFSVEGDLGKGNVTVRQSPGAVDEKEEEQVKIHMEEPVTLSFALRYLGFFTKATPLGPTVKLHMSPEVPIVVEYPMEVREEEGRAGCFCVWPWSMDRARHHHRPTHPISSRLNSTRTTTTGDWLHQLLPGAQDRRGISASRGKRRRLEGAAARARVVGHVWMGGKGGRAAGGMLACCSLVG